MERPILSLLTPEERIEKILEKHKEVEAILANYVRPRHREVLMELLQQYRDQIQAEYRAIPRDAATRIRIKNVVREKIGFAPLVIDYPEASIFYQHGQQF